MNLSLEPRHLKEVKNILEKFVPHHEVWAFGSRVTGKAKEYSDLDLTVISKKPLPLKTMSLMKEAFSESNLPFKVDLVDWSLISEEFQKVIEGGYCVISKSSPT